MKTGAETELIRRAGRGDTAAFEALAEAYRGPVYRLALRMCGNPHDAEEIAQEALVRCWQGLPSFRGEAAFSSWLYRLTSNAAVDFLRREKRQGNTLPLEEAVLPTAADPQQEAERSELRDALQRALAELPPEFREVFLLYRMEQLSYGEICAVTGLSPGTVKSRLSRANEKLRRILTETGNLSGEYSVQSSRKGGDGHG